MFLYQEVKPAITETHAYTEWINDKTGQPYARMLYDHRSDPEEK